MKLTFRDLVTIGLGLIIGSGVITVTGFGIGHTDTGILFAYLAAGLIFMFSMLPTLIVGVTIPRTSFSYSVTKELLHPIAGGMFLMTFFIGRIIMAFFGVAFANYVASILPNTNKLLVGIGTITVFYLINLLGVKQATKIQKFLNIILVVALVSFSFLGVLKLQPDAFEATRLFPNGIEGFIKAVALLMFSMGGGLVLLEFGGQVDNPQKTLFKAVLTVSAIATLLFGVVGLAGAGVLPYEQVANQPLTYAAQVIYPNNTGVLFFVIGGALMAIATTMISSFMWYSNTMIKGVEDGWFPKFIAKRNKYDAPYVLLTIFYIIGVVPIIINIPIGQLVTVATGLALLFFLIPNFALINLPKKYPEEWKGSIFYIKSQSVVTALTLFCSAIFIALILYNFSSYASNVLISIAALFSLGFLYVLLRYKKIDN